MKSHVDIDPGFEFTVSVDTTVVAVFEEPDLFQGCARAFATMMHHIAQVSGKEPFEVDHEISAPKNILDTAAFLLESMKATMCVIYEVQSESRILCTLGHGNSLAVTVVSNFRDVVLHHQTVKRAAKHTATSFFYLTTGHNPELCAELIEALENE